MKKDNIILERPPIRIPDRIHMPVPQIRETENGIKIYGIDCTEDPVLRFSFIFRAGTSLQHVPFSASTTANLLSEGSSSLSAHQIAEQLDFYGSYYNVALDRDYAVITFVTLQKFFDNTLDIARHILLDPVFPEEELQNYSLKRKEILTIERSKMSVKARELFVSSLFGIDHPYGNSYHQSLYDDLKRDDLIRFFRERYTAGNCFVVCSGKIGDREIDGVSSLASDLPSGGITSIPPFPPLSSTSVAFEVQPNALQSAIRIGRILFTRSHPDFLPMQMIAATLGGYFGSRLVHSLREERGFTYGVFSSLVNMEYEGYFAVSTEVRADATAEAVSLIFDEIERLKNEPIPAEELQMVKNIMIGEVMRVLDGPFGIADVTIENIQCCSDNNYIENFVKGVNKATPESLLEIARRYLTVENFTTTIVGPASVEPTLDVQKYTSK